ncbi:MAG: TonB-dependent receptor plug domain-containing protein, partial [Planctomycetota bacterium]
MFTERTSLVRKSIFISTVLVLFSIGPKVLAQQQEPNDQAELFEMSLEELMEVEVSVASRKESTQRESPGIVTVITREEIQKSGARDLVDILRLVPGFHVGYDTVGAYGVAVRGIWANEGKVLVLMDGVELNDDMYGSFQYGHHIPVDIVERIEIMRGPGSAMYGESAELGVISIKTIAPEK